ncbi:MULTISPECIES: ABC transporter ATP-binding protein [Microbacterium]|uniref:ABC transporter ATP-binding protein n=1 Tax=Microbacterium algeriense TaxID=2615184 RepID=A0ABQ6V6L2_9MICO|nr:MULTISPECIES: ABC transporter ATP-binding protein [Microbacterium]AZH78875.1 ABC transporter [Microbacterium sp. Y-01]KAB1864998.1 ABC transporter ATP-binding protein [Microbacterium algeriense]
MTALLPAPRTAVTSSSAGAAQAVRLDGIERSFPIAQGRRDVLRGVDLDIAAGEIVAVVGPSGCGKSTLLRLVGGLDAPTGGRIRLDGTAVADVDERTAIAFQEPRLLPWRTLAQNVELGLPRSTARRAGRERVRELLQLVGLEHAADQRPREVSGGMAQRASLARALARNPGVLLLDEPFGALDALTRLRMHDLLLEIHAAEPTTVLLVTHDVEEALYLADRVLLLRTLGGDDEPSIARTVAVPGARPRDRADRGLADLRADLLEGLGVDTHHRTTEESR